ncbi:hypothetical protein OAH55_02460 [Hellea sp.]|nr:hypothetical protein [Hellea sp.]MDB4844392.1 hypothetical protein [Hellea sp.]
MGENTKTDVEKIRTPFGGKGEIYKMPRSGDIYQCRMWLNAERRHLRKSLKTSNYTEAKLRAEELILETIQGVKQGKKFFGVTLQTIVDDYLEYRQKDVGVEGGITEGRLVTIRSQCRALLRVIPPTTRMSELSENTFYEWRQMRQGDNSNIRIVTIRNEQATINAIAERAYSKGLLSFPRFKFKKITISRDDIGKRSIPTPEEYDRLVAFMREYVSKKHNPDISEEERNDRLTIRDFIYVLSNTALRIGTLRRMRWGDIIKYEEQIDDIGQKATLVHINVRAETTKTRHKRNILSRGGEYLLRHKKRSQFTNPDDYIFTNRDGTLQIPTKILYKHWGVIMKSIGITDYKSRKLSYYSLRHWCITCRILAQVPIYDVALFAGTSVYYLETTYIHPTEEMRRRMALKNFTITSTGIQVRE